MRRRPREPLPPGFGAIWVTVAIDLVGFGIVLPLLPLYAREFDASDTTIGVLVATYSLMQLVFSPLWGRVSDRFGRKPVLVVSLVGSAVGSLLTGLAPALWVLFLGRVVDGISGGTVSVAQAAATDLAPPHARARLLGLIGAAFGVGFVVGPALGGLAALGGPALPFLLAAAIAAVNAVVALRRLPETNPSGRLRREGSTAAAVGDGAAAWRAPGVLRLVVVAFFALVAFSAFEATFSLLGEDRFGLDIASVAAVFVFIGVYLVVVQGALIHPLVSRWGELRTLQAGLVLDALGLAVLAVADTWPILVVALVLLVGGQGLLTPSLSAVVAAQAPAGRRGSVLGVQQSAGALARVVGPSAGGWLYHHHVGGGAVLGGIGVPSPYTVGAVLAVVALLLTLGEVAPRRVATSEAVVGS